MRTPPFNLIESTNKVRVYQLEIREDLDCFDGHFDEQPILPGVAQVTFAARIAKSEMSLSGTFVGMEVVKFQHVIIPPANVNLSLEYDAQKNKLYFKYYQKQQVFSSGRILFK